MMHRNRTPTVGQASSGAVTAQVTRDEILALQGLERCIMRVNSPRLVRVHLPFPIGPRTVGCNGARYHVSGTL
jgi:hypothetical protein